MHGNRIIGGTIAALTVGCLFLTAWIMHRSGALQGATEDGRWALGLAAIAVHLGLAVFGLAMFASRKLAVTLVCGLMVLGAAACSAWQIATFLATEVISVTKAREAIEKREDVRAAAALEAAKEQRKTQAKLAEDELKWSRGTTREVGGRRERKEMADARAKLIAEMGKAEMAAAAPAPKAETAPQVQSGAVAQWVAARMGWDETAMQASPYLMIALMLLAIEVVGWPMASFYWNRPGPQIITVTAEQVAPVPTPPRTEPIAAASELPALLLPAPEPAKVQPARLPPPRTRQPVSEPARAALDAVGYPWIKPRGPLLEQPLTAEKFAVWLRAFGFDGAHDFHKIQRLYQEACTEFHCEALSYKTLAGTLDNRRLGVVKKTGGPVTWIVTPFRAKKAAPEAAAEQPEQRLDGEQEPVSEGRRGIIPFSAAARAPHKPMARINFRQFDHPAIVQARAHALRREGRMVRRQRGARVNRRAA
jgi:hypothetical protein